MTYLSEAVDKMSPLLAKQPPQPDDLVRAASIGCDTLDQLLTDSNFKEHVQRSAKRLNPWSAVFRIFPGSRLPQNTVLKEFSDFLEEVRKLMIDQQIPPGIVDMICQQAEELQLPLSKWRGNFNDFFVLIERVRHDICELQSALERNRTNPVFLNEARMKLLWSMYVIAALTCFIANAVLSPNFSSFLLSFTSTLAGPFTSLVFQQPQFLSNISNQQARHLFHRKVAILAILPILMAILVVIFAFMHYSQITPTATVTATSVSRPLSFGSINASFYMNSNRLNGTFDTTSTSVPVFTQLFPVIAFNPDPSVQHCSSSTKVDTRTRPFTDVFQNPDGSCQTIRAQDGNGHAAGHGGLDSFEAVFLTSLFVPSKGLLTMQIRGDDGWIIAIGGDGGKLPSPEQGNVMTHPSSVDHKSPIYNYPEMGDNNLASAPTLFKIGVNFPDAGTYPVEIDYTECCDHELTLVVSNVFTSELSRSNG